MPVPLLAIAGGLQGLSAAANLIGQNRLRKGAGDALSSLRSSNQEYLSSLEDIRQRLSSEAPELDISDDAIMDLLANARADVTQAQGSRVVGEEIARDITRQSTADAISRARNTGSSVADLLGFAGAATNDERRAMNDLNMQFSRERQSRIDQSKSRLYGAMENRVAFERFRDQAMFQADRDQFRNEIDFARFAAGEGRNTALSEIAQQGAVDSVAAAMWGTAGNALASGSSFLQGMDQNNSLMDFLSGGSDSSPGTSAASSSSGAPVTRQQTQEELFLINLLSQ